MKLRTLVDSKEALIHVFHEKLPALTAKRFLKLIDDSNVHFKQFEDIRIKLVKEYGVPTEDNPDNYTVLEDKQEEFFKDINALLDEEVEIDVPEITLTQLGNITIMPVDLQLLEWLIKD
jgi:hypothetical protein